MSNSLLAFSLGIKLTIGNVEMFVNVKREIYSVEKKTKILESFTVSMANLEEVPGLPTNCLSLKNKNKKGLFNKVMYCN